MKHKIITVGLIASFFISCENVVQMVSNVTNEISESTDRIEEEISKSTNQIKDEVLKNVNLEAITNELLNVKHLDNIESVALKVVEYQNIANRISNLHENVTNGEFGALEVLAITQFAKNTQQELNRLKQESTSTETTQRIDSLLNRYQRVLDTYSQQNNRENNPFYNDSRRDIDEEEDFDN